MKESEPGEGDKQIYLDISNDPECEHLRKLGWKVPGPDHPIFKEGWTISSTIGGQLAASRQPRSSSPLR